MRRVPWIVGCLALVALPLPPLHAAEPRVNVVVDHVRSVRTVDGAAQVSALLVFVVDDAGDPIDEVGVVVLAGGRRVGSGTSDARGRVLLSLPTKGQVTVSAAEAGFVPSVARGVTLRHGELTGVVLPLEEAPLQDPPEDQTDDPDARPGGPARVPRPDPKGGAAPAEAPGAPPPGGEDPAPEAPAAS